MSATGFQRRRRELARAQAAPASATVKEEAKKKKPVRPK